MVGFPGLGIPDFRINGTLFSLGGFTIHWYGLIIAIGFFVAALYVCRRASVFGLAADDIIDMLIFAVPMAIIGARLYYVAFDWDKFKNDIPAIFRVWDGGIAIYGAVIFSVATCAVFCRYKRISAGAMLDAGALGLLIGQAIGRWGNFVNIEVYGTETSLPWRMTVDLGAGVHPLFLYEFLWNALGFALLHLLSKKRRFNGQIILLYVAWYGLGRGMLEGLRDPEFALMIGALRASQFVGFASFAAAFLLLLYHTVFKTHDSEDLFAWVEVRKGWAAARAGKITAGGEVGLEPVEEPVQEPVEEPAGELAGDGQDFDKPEEFEEPENE